MDTLVGWPSVLSDRAYTGPALFLSGGNSDYVTEAGEDAARRLFPAADFQKIPGTGHWLHAEAPEAFHDAVAGWLHTAEEEV
jgi:pimeloyl-ACP methyl ester carboxylesterase